MASFPGEGIGETVEKRRRMDEEPKPMSFSQLLHEATMAQLKESMILEQLLRAHMACLLPFPVSTNLSTNISSNVSAPNPFSPTMETPRLELPLQPSSGIKSKHF